MGVVGGKRVAGSGGLGEWVSGGRLTAGGGEVAGRACPAPTGWWKGERVLAGRCAGVGCFRAIFIGGGVLDVPRRGQDPSLQCGRLEGGYGKACGPGMPGPYGGRRGKRVLAGRCAGGVNFPTTTKEERRASPLLIYIAYFLWYILSSSS